MEEASNNYLYRGEQYDSDLGLYYLRARYYNLATGLFVSRDPLDGIAFMPITLRKYLYAGSDPVNYVDPSGRDLFGYAAESSAAVPEAKLVSIYGCFAGAGLAAASLVLSDQLDWRAGVGAAGAVFGCVTLYFPPASEAEGVVKVIIEYTPKVNYAFCGFAIEAVIHDFNDLANGDGNTAASLVDTLGTLAGCVGTRLGQLMDQEE